MLAQSAEKYKVLFIFLTFVLTVSIICIACSEGRSFNGNDRPDKAQAEMPVLIRSFLFFGQIEKSFL